MCLAALSLILGIALIKSISCQRKCEKINILLSVDVGGNTNSPRNSLNCFTKTIMVGRLNNAQQNSRTCSSWVSQAIAGATLFIRTRLNYLHVTRSPSPPPTPEAGHRPGHGHLLY